MRAARPQCAILVLSAFEAEHAAAAAIAAGADRYVEKAAGLHVAAEAAASLVKP